MAKFLQRMWALVRGKELVGKDNAGNVFYRHSTTVDGAVTERRWVEYVGEPNPRNLPAEWYSWLIGRRKDSPTEEDIMALEAYRQRVKMNATSTYHFFAFKSQLLRRRKKSDVLDKRVFNKMETWSCACSANECRLFDDSSTGESEQGSGKGGHKDPGGQRRKEQDVYEKWVPPS